MIVVFLKIDEGRSHNAHKFSHQSRFFLCVFFFVGGGVCLQSGQEKSVNEPSVRSNLVLIGINVLGATPTGKLRCCCCCFSGGGGAGGQFQRKLP